MGDLRVTTLTVEECTLPTAAVEAFKNSLRGQLLRPGDQGNNEARTSHNGMTDRCPALIAHCTGVADVITCVNVARENDLLVVRRTRSNRTIRDCATAGYSPSRLRTSLTRGSSLEPPRILRYSR
jgi:hypothetical protein